MRRAPAVVSVTALALAATAFAPALSTRAPEGVPDRGAVLAEPIDRGALLLTEAAAVAPSVKVVDGSAADWVGTPTAVGGASRFDAGELVHTDFLFDAHGADDGADRDRLDQFAGLLYEETRTQRIDQVLRTSGSQLGVPEPLGAPDEYGDVGGGLDVADLREVRLASDGTTLHLLASVTNLTDPAGLGVLVLADTGGGGLGDLGVGGLSTDRFDVALFAHDGTVTGVPGAVTATGAAGWENHLELAVPAAAVAAADGTVDLAVVAGRVEQDGAFTPLNVAFRAAEPLEIWNDRAQAFALLDGTVDAFSSGPVALADLAAGRTQDWAFGPGYHERHVLDSREDMSAERGRDGVQQPYGLYVPTAYDPASDAALPLTYWLHYRGGKAHSGTVINPRLTTQLGEERGNLVAFPNGRGTSEWYVTESHQDVFEVMGDVESLFEVDETRRYVSGYSMGGYGSWLFTTLYPDLFAAAFAQSGAITQGAWLGLGADEDPIDPFELTAGRTPAEFEEAAGEEAPDDGYVQANGGDAQAQLTYRAVENLRHVPFAIDHGTNDELALNPQIERMALRLTELGYQHRFTRFLGYEHFTQAIVDEWADGAAYLDRFVLDPDPREVTYAVVPALVHALNTVDPAQGATFDFRPDGAYWVDDVVVREVGERTPGDPDDPRPALDAKGTVQATAHAIDAPATIAVPDVGAVSLPGHTTPFVRTGLQHVEDPIGLSAVEVTDALTLALTNVASVSVDVPRTGTTVADGVFTITTDGPVTVRLVDALAGVTGRPPTLAGEGAVVTRDGSDLVVTIAQAGTVVLEAVPGDTGPGGGRPDHAGRPDDAGRPDHAGRP